MSSSLKKALRLLAIAAAVVAVSLAFTPGPSGSGPYASTLDESDGATPVMGPPCPNNACITWCFADGCKHNAQTKCDKTAMEPLKCPDNTGGCLTHTC